MRTRPIWQARLPVLGQMPLALLTLWVVMGTPQAADAVNGLNLIGSGGWSSALAGADTAIALDFTTMNTNPAGMSRIAMSATSVSTAPPRKLGIRSRLGR